MLTKNQRQRLWEFVRGDAKMSEFEAWLYNDKTLETALGNDVYLELIGCNFSSKEDTFNTKNSLRSILENEESCQCASVRNLDSLEMGGDWFFEKFFATLNEVAKPQTDQWWLYISRCNVCATKWLVAQEERIHDVFYVQRISDEALQDAENGKWPDQFQTFADVLDIGVELGGHQARFVDPMSDALQVTVEDLLRTHPEISAEDVGKKLGVDPEHAESLITKVTEEGADPVAGSFVSKPD